MKIKVVINFICYDYVGSNKYKLFLTNENELPSLYLEEDESLESCLIRLTSQYFNSDPKWVLTYLSLNSVHKVDKELFIEYSSLVPELTSERGRFIKSSNLQHLSHVLNNLKV